MSHTKEPWEYAANSHYHEVNGSDRRIGDTCASSCSGNWPLGQANARRIVACVNACAGLSTEELEERGLSSVTFKRKPRSKK